MWRPAPGVSRELLTLIKSFQSALKEKLPVSWRREEIGTADRQIVRAWLDRQSALSIIQSDSQIKNKILGPNHTITSVSVMITVTFWYQPDTHLDYRETYQPISACQVFHWVKNYMSSGAQYCLQQCLYQILGLWSKLSQHGSLGNCDEIIVME